MMKSVQVYLLHLTNGDVISTYEDFDKHGKDTVATRFSDMSKNGVWEICNLAGDIYYVPKANILYISTGDVLEVPDFNPYRKKGG